MIICPVKVESIFKSAESNILRDEYIEECAIAGLPRPHEKECAYYAMEQNGALYSFGAYKNKELIGFIIMIAPIMPHYGRMITVIDSIFVASKHRKSGAGLALIRQAETLAKSINSPGIFMSAPVNSRLEKLLPRIKYRPTNTVFFKSFCNE